MATVVIDANLALALVLELPYSEQAEEHLSLWRANNIGVAVPALWWYEVVSSLRKAIVANYISDNDVMAALDDLNGIGIKTYEPTRALHRRSLMWAERIKQTAAYDAQYISLAEFLHAELWTADKKLASSAHAANATFVHLLQSSLLSKSTGQDGGTS